MVFFFCCVFVGGVFDSNVALGPRWAATVAFIAILLRKYTRCAWRNRRARLWAHSLWIFVQLRVWIFYVAWAGVFCVRVVFAVRSVPVSVCLRRSLANLVLGVFFVNLWLSLVFNESWLAFHCHQVCSQSLMYLSWFRTCFRARLVRYVPVHLGGRFVWFAFASARFVALIVL